MAAESPTSTTINPSPAQPVAPISKTKEKRQSRYVAIVPVVVLLLAGAMLFSITGNWNSWISSREIQETDDAYVRADLTPLSTRVSGTVAERDRHRDPTASGTGRRGCRPVPGQSRRPGSDAGTGACRFECPARRSGAG